MYRHVIRRDIENLQYGFAQRPKNMPTVLSPQEIASILNQLKGQYWLMTALLYGCGFRIHEALSLRMSEDEDTHSTLRTLNCALYIESGCIGEEVILNLIRAQHKRK
jgi:integrase